MLQQYCPQCDHGVEYDTEHNRYFCDHCSLASNCMPELTHEENKKYKDYTKLKRRPQR